MRLELLIELPETMLDLGLELVAVVADWLLLAIDGAILVENDALD